MTPRERHLPNGGGKPLLPPLRQQPHGPGDVTPGAPINGRAMEENPAAPWNNQARKGVQQGGLSSAVEPQQAPALARREAPVESLVKGAAREGVAKPLGGQHDLSSSIARAVPGKRGRHLCHLRLRR